MMSVKEVKDLAMKNYEIGGDVIIECWEDADIEDWIAKSGGTVKKLMKLFSTVNEVHNYDDYRGGY